MDECVGHVAHSYRVPAAVLYLALGLPEKPPDKRPLREIAKMQHRSMDEIRAILLEPVVHARTPYSAPQSPPGYTRKIHESDRSNPGGLFDLWSAVLVTARDTSGNLIGTSTLLTTKVEGFCCLCPKPFLRSGLGRPERPYQKRRGVFRLPAWSLDLTSGGEVVGRNRTEFVWKRDIWVGCTVLVLKAGDGDRTRDVQLGKLAFYR